MWLRSLQRNGGEGRGGREGEERGGEGRDGREAHGTTKYREGEEKKRRRCED